MTTISRHVLGEFLKVFLTTLAVVMIAVVLSDVVKELQNRGFRLPQIVLILPYLIPYAVKSAMHGRRTCCSRPAACLDGWRRPMNWWPSSPWGLPPCACSGRPSPWRPRSACWPCCSTKSIPTWGGSGIQQVLIDHVDEVAYGILRRGEVSAWANLRAGRAASRGTQIDPTHPDFAAQLRSRQRLRPATASCGPGPIPTSSA